MATNIKVQSISQSTGRRCMHAFQSWPAFTLQTVNTEGGHLGRGKLGLLSQTLVPAGGICVERSILFEVINSSKAQFFTWFGSMTLKYKWCYNKILLKVYVVSPPGVKLGCHTDVPVYQKILSHYRGLVSFMWALLLSSLLSHTHTHKARDCMVHSGTPCQLRNLYSNSHKS